jgi:hypothetical protein
MVQISTHLSRFFRWAWPSASENGATTTMDENKLLMGRFLQWKATGENTPQHVRIHLAVTLELLRKSTSQHFIPDEMP